MAAAGEFTDPMISVDWLRKAINDRSGPDNTGIKVLDATYMMPQWQRDARAEFEKGHIPGARFFDIDAISDQTRDLPHMVPTPTAFADAVGALGVGNADHVVVYDTHGLLSAARCWWMFRLFGHDNVSVLDGGLPAWKSAGLPIETGPAVCASTQFQARLRPELIRSREQIVSVVEGAGGQCQIVDARAGERFDGTVDDGWPGRRRGHIPGSRNLPFVDLVNPDSGLLHDASILAQKFVQAGIDVQRPVCTSCGSGVTACVLALGLHRLGVMDAAVYDGSWAEWGLDPSLATETGPAR